MNIQSNLSSSNVPHSRDPRPGNFLTRKWLILYKRFFTMNFFQHILGPTLMRYAPKSSDIQRLPYLQHTADVFNNILRSSVKRFSVFPQSHRTRRKLFLSKSRQCFLDAWSPEFPREMRATTNVEQNVSQTWADSKGLQWQ